MYAEIEVEPCLPVALSSLQHSIRVYRENIKSRISLKCIKLINGNISRKIALAG